MRLVGLLVFLFLLSAFAIGSSIPEDKINEIDLAINNITIRIDEIELNYNETQESQIPNMEGFFDVLEKYIKFVGTFAIEVMRAGIYFGNDNPDYFEPSFILKIITLIFWLIIISLLIKPLVYLIILIVLLGMFINNKIKKRKQKHE